MHTVDHHNPVTRKGEVGRSLFVLGVTLSVGIGAAWASPKRTRWMDPENVWQPHAAVPLGPAAGVAEVKLEGPAGGPRGRAAWHRGRVAVMVETDLYDSISASVSVYVDDLADIGFTSAVMTISGTAGYLRNTLHTLYQEPESLVGAVLIGELPYVIFEVNEGWGYADFACDYYFMDLNGYWGDDLDNPPVEPGNGKLDTWSGDTEVDIWVSRMRAGNLPALGAEAALLNNFFARNHVLRWDLLNSSHVGLVYDDDDWAGDGPVDTACLASFFGTENVVTIDHPEETTAYDYISQRLTADYQLDLIRSHGSPSGHGFYRNNMSDFDWVSRSEYTLVDPEASLFSLFVCSGADYTYSDYLAGTIVFNPEGNGLLAWGSTKTGGMNDDHFMYDQMAAGKCVGEGFKRWVNEVKDLPYAPDWYYGMVLVGDGSLCEYPVDCNDNGILDDSEIPITCGGLCLQSCDPDCNCNGIPDACDGPDCNANSIPDECEIPSSCGGLCSADCDPDCNCNAIPDACEVDCNANGVPDDCDITSGSSDDCNSSGIPDDCEILGGGGLLLEEDFAGGLPVGWSIGGVFLLTNECGAYHPYCGHNLWAYAGRPAFCAYDDLDVGGLTAPAVTLGYGVSELTFCSRLETELHWDFGRIYVNGAVVWSQSGGDGQWEEHVVDLQAYAGQTVTLTFEFQADSAISGGLGWQVDNIHLFSQNLDCNLNGVPDDCDIAEGTSEDGNSNGVPDECEISPPLPEPGGAGCVTAEDCVDQWKGADCVAGMCYVPKNRYLTIDPQTNDVPVAYQVELTESVPYPTAVGRTWWVEEPVCYNYPDGDPVPGATTCSGADRFAWVSGLTDTPITRTWTETPLHLTACGIAPVVTYCIRASADEGTSFSNPLEIGTAHDPEGEAQSWGDITGGPMPDMPGLWLPPEHATNFGDVDNAIRTFEKRTAETGFPPRVWVDVEINQVINLGDIQFIVGAFEGSAYADIQLELIGIDPSDCP